MEMQSKKKKKASNINRKKDMKEKEGVKRASNIHKSHRLLFLVHTFPLLIPQRDKQINQSVSQSVNQSIPCLRNFQIVRSSL